MEKRKVALQEAKLKAKGLNPDGTPALSTLGGFSPASKPGTIHETGVFRSGVRFRLCRVADVASVSILKVLPAWLRRMRNPRTPSF